MHFEFGDLWADQLRNIEIEHVRDAFDELGRDERRDDLGRQIGQHVHRRVGECEQRRRRLLALVKGALAFAQRLLRLRRPRGLLHLHLDRANLSQLLQTLVKKIDQI